MGERSTGSRKRFGVVINMALSGLDHFMLRSNEPLYRQAEQIAARRKAREKGLMALDWITNGISYRIAAQHIADACAWVGYGSETEDHRYIIKHLRKLELEAGNAVMEGKGIVTDDFIRQIHSLTNQLTAAEYTCNAKRPQYAA